MTQPHLLVAEVDKIQSFVFRSTKLKEIVGASHLLEDFCFNLAQHIEPQPTEVISSAGGNFRLVFASEEDAYQAARHLKALFEAEIGGSITIAPPTPYFGTADDIREGNRILRKEKLSGKPSQTFWHMPIHAICSSCGIELATSHQAKYQDEAAQYICHSCHIKANTAHRERINFFKPVLKTLSTHRECENGVQPYSDYAQAETYAWGPRRYVAYLSADGNRMGKLFGKSSPQQLKRISNKLQIITAEILAEATHPMMLQPGADWCKMPILPLIMGGDDLLALMPALWAFDVAQRFCTAYETRMTAALIAEGILPNEQMERATVGVGIAICKATYPYQMAQERAHQLMEKAKKVSKLDGQSRLSVDVILGSQSVESPHEEPASVYTPQLARSLIEARNNLHNKMSSRTLHRIRQALYRGEGLAAIQERLHRRAPKQYEKLQNVLSDLSSSLAGEPYIDETLQANDMLYDVLVMWNYACDLEQREELVTVS